MKFIPVHIYTLVAALIFIMKAGDSAPSLLPAVPRGARVDDDDLGLLLTVLVLATKNKPCNCCNRPENIYIPIPYPIPIPTNNPIIVTKLFGNDCDKEEESSEQENGYSSRSDSASSSRANASAAGGGGGAGGAGGAGGNGAATSSSQATQVINIHTCDCEESHEENHPHKSKA